MAFSDSLKVLLPDQGALTGTWGTALNNQVFALLDSAIAGRKVIGASDSPWSDANPSIHTLTDTEGAANEARAAIIHLVTYNSLPAAASTATLVVPDRSKAYIINNSLTDARNIVKVCTTTGASDANSVFVPKGAVAEVYCDGAGKISSAQNFVVDGVIENTTIGATTPSTGKFTTLEATGAATLVAGTINATTIGASTASTGKFTTLEATGAATLVAGTINGTTIGASTASTGKFTTLEATGAATLVAGTINATTIGASTPSTGAFTTLVATTIGAASQGSGKFTTLEASGNIKSTAGTGQFYGAGSRDSNTVIGSATSPSSWTTDAVDTILIGKNAGEDITSGSENILIGKRAGEDVTTGLRNVSIGARAGLNVTEGGSNIFIGVNAGGSSTDKGVISGNENTIIGPQAGYLLGAATSRSVIIGSGLDSQETDLSDTVLIGTGSFGGDAVERLKIDANGAQINGVLRVGKFGIVPTIYDSYSDLPANGSGQVDGEMALYRSGSEITAVAFWDQNHTPAPVWKFEFLAG